MDVQSTGIAERLGAEAKNSIGERLPALVALVETLVRDRL